MLRGNKWTGGRVQLQLPPLPPEWVGQSGAMVQFMVFDPNVGEEVALCLLDDQDFARQLGKLDPFDLTARMGVVRTSRGLIAFVIWTVSSREGHVVDYEHPLNPFETATIRLLDAVGQQSHLKVVIVDSYHNESVGFYEFENVFNFDRVAASIRDMAANEPVADFLATQAALQAEYTLEDLKNA